MRRRCIAVGACLACGAGLVACAAGTPSTSTLLEPLEGGGQSGVAERSFRVIGDERAFRALYAAVHANRMPSPRPPGVEFDAHVVLAAFLGTRSTGGHHTGFGPVTVEGGVARVSVAEESPPAGAVLTQATTTPYAMATLARSDLKAVELVDGKGAVVLREALP